MFRKKDVDPIRPAGMGDKPAEAAVHSPLELRSQASAEAAPPRPILAPMSRDAKPAATTDEAGKRLIVGQGISLSGEITACDRLVVDGSVQVTLNQTRAIEITESGRFTNGKAEVEEAEISGVYEGDLTVRKRLLIRSTGQVKGTVRYGELEIERGGRLSGTISMLEASES
ncbi:MAG: polymer-forming cytoskeletal protein [Geminicoccaceae bacterium]